VTGGYAGASYKTNLADTAAAPNVFNSHTGYMNGYALGAGVEYALTQNISVKGEYLFTSFGSQGVFGGTPDFAYSGLNASLVRAGINYHF
jgi:outer membrane immunogenic protein